MEIIVFKVTETYEGYEVIDSFWGSREILEIKGIVFFDCIEVNEETWDCKLKEAA